MWPWWLPLSGTNNSLSLRRVYISLPPPLVSWGQTQILTILRRLPAFIFSSPSLSFSPFSHFTHLNQKRNGVSSSTVTATSLPDAKPSKLQYTQAAWYLGTGLRVYRTTFAWSRGSASGEDLPVETNGIGDSRKKFDRDRITLITGNSSRVPSSRVVDSRQNLDANQSN